MRGKIFKNFLFLLIELNYSSYFNAIYLDRREKGFGFLYEILNLLDFKFLMLSYGIYLN